MKGPSGRGRHPIRRTWQCPRCQKRMLTSGGVTQLQCSCTTDSAQPVWMALVHEPRPRPFGLPPVIDEEIQRTQAQTAAPGQG